MRNVKHILRDGTFTALTKMFANEAGHVVVPTLTGPARGLRFGLDLKSFGEPPYFYGTYELSEANALASLVCKGWTVWDCGIYLGYYTNLLARLVGENGRVVAFEPDPRNIARTKTNLALNKLSNVQIVQAAIGAPATEIEFVFSNNTNSHAIGAYIGDSYEDYSETERRDELTSVRSMSLDEAYENPEIPRPQLVKIDIEGAELIALKYIGKMCTELRPVIILELHNPECDAAAWDFSQRYSYSMQSLDTGQVLETREAVRGTLLCTAK
jgi:FkbM family methyltransferase